MRSTTTRSLLLAMTIAAPSLAAPEEPAANAPTSSGAPIASPATSAPATSAPAPPEPPKRILFVPETVKAQLRDEIKQELLAQARKEGWALPGIVPDWLSRLKLRGDVRVRLERDLLLPGNANGEAFPDFNAINTGKPFDVNFFDVANERYLNTGQSRTRPRLRATVGLDADIGQGFSAATRLATGESANPGSANQTLGASGGDFSKYQVWLDRAFIRYQATPSVGSSLSIRLGRFDNPFWNTELLWAPDVNFDGAAVDVRLNAHGPMSAWLTFGAFPIYTTGIAFPAEALDKFVSFNKWLYAAQIGADWKVAPGVSLKVASGFYYFDKAEGRASNGCDTNLSSVSCDSDESRPSFAQKGNSYVGLRVPSARALASEPLGAPRYQFFGLASRFRELVVTARLGVNVAPPILFELEAEYVRNAGFVRSQIADRALNNRGAAAEGETIGAFRGGNSGVLGRLGFGSPTQAQRGDWRVRLGYRYLESDAVLDGLNDQDFGLGGTNLKGYTLDATVWVASGVALSGRWFSADQVVGPTYSVDVAQVDLQLRY